MMTTKELIKALNSLVTQDGEDCQAVELAILSVVRLNEIVSTFKSDQFHYAEDVYNEVWLYIDSWEGVDTTAEVNKILKQLYKEEDLE